MSLYYMDSIDKHLVLVLGLSFLVELPDLVTSANFGSSRVGPSVYLKAVYRVVQLGLTPEIEVLLMPLGISPPKFTSVSLKQHKILQFPA